MAAPRLTAQGIRDLNYYGPRRVNPATVAAAPTPAAEAESPPADLPAETPAATEAVVS